MPRSNRRPASGRGKRSSKSGDSVSAASAKGSQRERLLEAMIELCGQRGYQAVSIAQLSTRAGVSSATFYEQFDSKEDCFVAAYSEASDRVLARVQVGETPNEDWSEIDWAQGPRTALARLLEALQSEPNAGRLLFIEALAGGPSIRERRGAVLNEFESRIQMFLDNTPAQVGTLDVPPVAVIGALRSIIVRRLRTHAEDELPSLAPDIVSWVESYAKPAGQERWSTGPQAILAEAPPSALNLGARAPIRLPRGRHGLPAGVVARSRRTRIIHATAEVMMSKGYADTTVADIVATAGIARDVFYEHFENKQHAFLEAQQHSTQNILDACATAFFSAKRWPERVWRGLEILIAIIASNPELSHLRLVECYAAGPTAVRRAEEVTRAFTIFLEEGYGYRAQASKLPRLSSQAIAGAFFEVIQRHVARGESAALPRELPRLTYIAIAPFTGPEKAIELVEQMSAQAQG
jgi:AcrR family transcriptional regulator